MLGEDLIYLLNEPVNIYPTNHELCGSQVRTLASLNAMATPGGFQDYGFDIGDDFDEEGFQSATRVVPA